jgi:hypothetical protein
LNSNLRRYHLLHPQQSSLVQPPRKVVQVKKLGRRYHRHTNMTIKILSVMYHQRPSLNFPRTREKEEEKNPAFPSGRLTLVKLMKRHLPLKTGVPAAQTLSVRFSQHLRFPLCFYAFVGRLPCPLRCLEMVFQNHGNLISTPDYQGYKETCDSGLP